MKIDVLTLFPGMFAGPLDESIIKRAREKGILDLQIHNLRDWTHDRHKTVDDRPYGGGPGMVMLPGPLAEAIEAARAAQRAAGLTMTRTVHLTPAGIPLTHARVVELAGADNAGYVLVAGRYEGIDERVAIREVDEEIAVGDFVVSGGELPALMVIDAIARQLPGALNDADSVTQESFVAGLLDCPHYTRPEIFEGMRVPAVLLSGNHAAIARWRKMQALGRTSERRPALLQGRTLTALEQDLLAQYRSGETQ